MTPIRFTLTEAGLAAAVSKARSGLDLALTHVQLGSGARIPAGTEAALLNPQQAVAIAGGSKPTPTQLRISANFQSDTNYPINEIGIFSGDPLDGGVLFAYWSQPGAVLAQKFAGVDFIFAYDMTLGSSSPGNVVITVDPGGAQALAVVAEHEGKADPHPQYARARGQGVIFVKGADWGGLSQPSLLGADEHNLCGLALDLSVDGDGSFIDLGTL